MFAPRGVPRHAGEPVTQTLHAVFSTEIFMARGHSYLWTPWLLLTQVAANVVLAVACVALAVIAFRRAARAPEQRVALRGLALLALAFAALHVLDTWVIWTPAYGI